MKTHILFTIISLSVSSCTITLGPDGTRSASLDGAQLIQILVEK